MAARARRRRYIATNELHRPESTIKAKTYATPATARQYNPGARYVLPVMPYPGGAALISGPPVSLA